MEKNEDKFLQIFRNIFIKNLILKFIHKKKSGYSYQDTISLELMLRNEKYNMVIDKLKSNQFIFVNRKSLKLLFKNYPLNIYFNEIFQLLWLNYKERIKRINPIEIIMNLPQSDNLFNYIYNNYYKQDIYNNMKINRVVKNVNYQLYDFIDLVFQMKEYKKINNVPKLLLKFINYSKSNLEDYETQQTQHKKQKLEISDNNLKSNKELINSIYLDLEIPIFMGYNFSGILTSTSNKVDFINENLKLNILEQIKKYCIDGPLYSFGKNITIALRDNHVLVNKTIEIFKTMALYGNFKITVNESCIHLNNLNYLKLYLLKTMSSNSKYEEFKLILRNSNINTIESLVKLVKKNFCQSKEELFYYFRVYLIYYYIKKRNYKKIKVYIDNNLNDAKFIENRPKDFSLVDIKILCYELLFAYCIFHFSIEIFTLYEDIGKDCTTFSRNKYIFYEIVPNEIEHDRIVSFFNIILSEKYIQYLSPSHITKIINIIVTYHSGSTLEFIIGRFERIKKEYILYIFKFIDGSFIEHFNIAHNNFLSHLDIKKIEVYIEYIQNIPYEQFQDINMDEIHIVISHYGTLLNHLLKMGVKRNLIISDFIKYLYDKCSTFEIDNCIKVFGDLNQELLKNYFFEILKNEDNNQDSISYYLNKSNILIRNLIISLVEKNVLSINKLLSIINNTDVLLIPPEIIYNNGIHQLIYYIFINGYANNIDYKYFIEFIIGFLHPPKELIFSIIPREDINLIQFYNSYYKNTVSIKYYLSDILEIEESQDINEDRYELLYLNDSSSEEENEEELVENIKRKDFSKTLNIKDLPFAFILKYYQAVYDYIEEHGPIKKELNLLKNGGISTINISLEWFKKLYSKFIRIHLNDINNVIIMVTNNCFEIFEFLWENHLTTFQLKLKFFKELFSLDLYQLKFKYKQILNYHPIKEYFLKEKKQFIISLGLNQQYIKDFIKVSIIHGTIKMFELCLDIFKEQYSFRVEYDLILDLLYYSEGNYCCNVIEYLYINNYIPNLREIVGDENLYKLSLSGSSSSTVGVSKSTFILIYSIIKSQSGF